jgi:hypothetical protein
MTLGIVRPFAVFPESACSRVLVLEEGGMVASSVHVDWSLGCDVDG